jgi:hypothetical protein
VSPKVLINMKNKEELITEIQSKKVFIEPMTEEELQQMATLSQKSFFKEKYRHGLKILTQMDIERHILEHPEWQLKDVLAAILKNYNPELPAIILLEMTQFIITEWEKTHVKENAKTNAMFV